MVVDWSQASARGFRRFAHLETDCINVELSPSFDEGRELTALVGGLDFDKSTCRRDRRRYALSNESSLSVRAIASCLAAAVKAGRPTPVPGITSIARSLGALTVAQFVLVGRRLND